MASLCASSAIAAISSLDNDFTRYFYYNNFLGRKKLRLKRKLSVPAVSTSAASVRVVAADPERPIWFPGSTPPEWLDASDPDSLKWNAQAELVHFRAKYFTDKTTLIVVELILIGWQGSVNTDPIFPNNKLTGIDMGYPGGLWFDPLGWGSGSPVMGAWFQHIYTGTGPIDNLFAHLADPGHATIFAVSVIRIDFGFVWSELLSCF
ncbi:hypothetical protein Bca52824_080157 [Brassica carinata]|uniref:Chlorophyll a-b binding protein, chloroplastic n=1 Tax=Brassica carinata TaxID=52824 RepID=A0A8X7Q0Y0_BRACI|nr:hypothetical protein Bca52824_080157 [Brassica carinata]